MQGVLTNLVDRGQFQASGHHRRARFPIEAHRPLTAPASFFTTTVALLESKQF